MVKCDYCNNELSCLNSLKTHQKISKKCLEIQRELNINNNNEQHKCGFCDYQSPMRQNKDRHEASCKHRYTNMEEKYETQISDLKETHQLQLATINQTHKSEISTLHQTIDQLTIQNQSLIRQQEIMKIEYKNIKERLDEAKNMYNERLGETKNIYNERLGETKNIYSEQLDKQSSDMKEVIKEISTTAGAKTNIKTSNRNTQNILIGTVDLSSDYVKSVAGTYSKKYYDKGQIGQADWATKHVLKGGYICTDLDRRTFTYNDTNGQKIKDIKATSLKNAIKPVLQPIITEHYKEDLKQINDEDDPNSFLFDKVTAKRDDNKELGIVFEKRLIQNVSNNTIITNTDSGKKIRNRKERKKIEEINYSDSGEDESEKEEREKKVKRRERRRKENRSESETETNNINSLRENEGSQRESFIEEQTDFNQLNKENENESEIKREEINEINEIKEFNEVKLEEINTDDILCNTLPELINEENIKLDDADTMDEVRMIKKKYKLKRKQLGFPEERTY